MNGFVNPLIGKPLRYLIGKDEFDNGRDGFVTEVGYDTQDHCPERGIGIKYCNLFDETNSGNYGPYLKGTDVSEQYDEGVIDPKGPGWLKNLTDQALRAKAQGFTYVELDNPDAYEDTDDVFKAVTFMQESGLRVIAKNPLLCDDPALYMSHKNIYGAIVERDAGWPGEMNGLRKACGEPDLPIWFVSFGSGRSWAQTVADQARSLGLYNVGVTYCTKGEYKNAAIDLLTPRQRT